MSVQSTIDSFEFARARRTIEGEVAIASLPRLAEFVAATDGMLRYRIEGVVDDAGHPGADLSLRGRLHLICQRCNAPFDFDVDQTTRFRFVASEEELNALPVEDDEVEAVVGSRAMNVHDWIEDEVILSLPLVPRHGDCAPAIEFAVEPEAVAARNPFAVLAALRNGTNGNDPRG